MQSITSSVCAVVAFRQTFAAVFDFRYNRILLQRTISLSHRASAAGAPFYPYPPPPIDGTHLPVSCDGRWGCCEEGRFGALGDGTVLNAGVAGRLG